MLGGGMGTELSFRPKNYRSTRYWPLPGRTVNMRHQIVLLPGLSPTKQWRWKSPKVREAQPLPVCPIWGTWSQSRLFPSFTVIFPVCVCLKPINTPPQPDTPSATWNGRFVPCLSHHCILGDSLFKVTGSQLERICCTMNWVSSNSPKTLESWIGAGTRLRGNWQLTLHVRRT